MIRFSFLAWLHVLLGCCGFSATLDFEQVLGTQPYEGLTVSNQFQSYFGISFRRATNQMVRWPVIARVGSPQSAFDRGGSVDSDTPGGEAAASFGTYFLTETSGVNGGGILAGPLILDFAAPVSRASGYILDIDSDEVVVVTAFPDLTGTNALEQLIFLRSDGGDGANTYWSFARLNREIRRIEIEGYGAPLGHDLFSSDYIPTDPIQPHLDLALYPGVTIRGEVGQPYAIDYADVMDRQPGGTNWHSLSTNILPSSPFTYFDLTATNISSRFYRTRIP